MSYSSIRTKHSVGDVVYFHDRESDTVQRGVVVGITATSTDSNHTPKWNVLYDVSNKFASDPGKLSLMAEDYLHDSPTDAWPPVPATPEAG